MRSFQKGLKANLALRIFGITKVPMIAYVRPLVGAMDDSQCMVRIPLSRCTHNHFGSMYFGALTVSTDCASGLLAMRLIKKRGVKFNLIFNDFKASSSSVPKVTLHLSVKTAAPFGHSSNQSSRATNVAICFYLSYPQAIA